MPQAEGNGTPVVSHLLNPKHQPSRLGGQAA